MAVVTSEADKDGQWFSPLPLIVCVGGGVKDNNMVGRILQGSKWLFSEDSMACILYGELVHPSWVHRGFDLWHLASYYARKFPLISFSCT